MFARTKKFLDDHAFEIAGGTFAAGVAVGIVAVSAMAARIGAQEGFKQGANLLSRAQLVNQLDEREVATLILKGIKTIKQAEKAAKIAAEAVA